MNCLFTVNINNFVSEYVRHHFLKACARWKCDYAELSHPCVNNYPVTAKWFAAEKLSGYENVIFVDGDAVISEHAPDPFDLCVEPDTLYAVTDLQAGNPNELWREWVYKRPIAEFLESHPGFKIHPETLAFNGGVIMFKPGCAIRSMLKSAREHFPKNPKGYADQGFLNVFVYNTPAIALRLLSLAWNHMVLDQNEPLGNYYINHFGGSMQAYLKTKQVTP